MHGTVAARREQHESNSDVDGCARADGRGGLVGFSVNHSIVIFDRIRENLRNRRGGEAFSELSERSMTEGFDRAVNTSFAVMLALLMMVLFGGKTLRLFDVALLFGMAFGTYSSVFVASRLVVLLEQRAGGVRSAERGGQTADGGRRTADGTAALPSLPSAVSGPPSIPHSAPAGRIRPRRRGRRQG
jgi:hypothetical protein